MLSGLFAVSAFAQDPPPALTGPDTPVDYVDPNNPPTDQIPRLTTRVVNFTWNRGAMTNGNQVDFRIWAGSLPGSGEIADSGFIAAVNDKANYNYELEIPANGARVYIRLHWTILEAGAGGVVTPVFKWRDYVYLAANQHYIYSPTPGTTFPVQDVDGCKAPPSVTFKWEVVPALGEPDRWWLYVGTSPLANDVHNSGELPASAREHTVNNIPTTGGQLFVTLWWEKGDSNTWVSNEYVYGAPRLPSIVVSNPLPGTDGAFVLKANGLDVGIYWVYAGTQPDTQDLHSAGVNNPTGEEEVLVSFQNFSDDGSLVYVTLFWRLAGEGPDKWKCRKYVYMASSGPVITKPRSGGDNPETLPTAPKDPTNTELIQWEHRGTVAQQLQVVLNTSGDPADNGFWRSGLLPGDATEVSAPSSAFTTDGSTVYIILRYWVSGGLAEENFDGSRQAAYSTKRLPYLTAPGSIVKCFENSLGNEATFTWADGGFTNDGDPPLGWWLYLGREAGASDIFNSDALGPDVYEQHVTTMPTDGEALWARLWYLIQERVEMSQPLPDGSEQIMIVVTQRWLCRDFKFTNPRCPEITSPTPGARIIGAQHVVVIDKRGVNVDGLWITVSSQAPAGGDPKNPNPGIKDIDDSNLLSPDLTSYTVRNLPIDDSTVYITLWWLVTNNQVTAWKFRTVKYISSLDAPVPSLVVPEPNKEVNATDLEFAWRTNNAVVFGWWLYVADNGDNGGENGSNITNSGFLQPQENDPNHLVTYQVTGLPCGTFYVTLWYLDQNLLWQAVKYTFNNVAGCGGGGNPGPGGPPSS